MLLIGLLLACVLLCAMIFVVLYLDRREAEQDIHHCREQQRLLLFYLLKQRKQLNDLVIAEMLAMLDERHDERR